jgi:hypothetical protein
MVKSVVESCGDYVFRLHLPEKLKDWNCELSERPTGLTPERYSDPQIL